MDHTENLNEDHSVLKLRAKEKDAAKDTTYTFRDDIAAMKQFFYLSGGSILYCVSAVFLAYGIVKLLGPVLSESESFQDALSCIYTLHVYELALLGVLILIVARKVVDDAISIVVLIALFLVGSSMLLGSVADRDVTLSLIAGLVGIVLALGKILSLRFLTKIPFKKLSSLGFVILISGNYLGPVWLARLLAIDPAQEMVRRHWWMVLWLILIAGTGLVVIEALRERAQPQEQQNDRPVFLQSSIMVYLFVLIVVAASGVHQYANAFIFALERVWGDYVPIVCVASILLIELLRHSGKRFGALCIVISVVPFFMTMLTIQQKSVLAGGQWSMDLLCYPPVILGLFGLAMAVLAYYHRWRLFGMVAAIYGLGVILTFGFAPEKPYELNFKTSGSALVIALVVSGVIRRNPHLCVAGILFLCFGLSQSSEFINFATTNQLTEIGSLAGVGGIALIILYVIFGQLLVKVYRYAGILCLSGFIYDYLPGQADYRYLFVLVGAIVLLVILLLRTRDWLIVAILFVPLLVKLYILAKYIASWRFVILGFLLLAVGAVVSLFKRPVKKPEDV